MSKTAIVLSAMFLTVLAAAGEPKPDWVDGSSMEYPREKYLVGVGFADDRATAEDRARAAISKVFSTQVTVNTNVSASEHDTAAEGKSAASFTQAVSENLQTASQNVLQAVSIAETWQDAADQRYYALAILDRDQGMASMRERIVDLDKQTIAWRDKLEKASEKFERVQCGMKLLATLKARMKMDSQYQVLDPQGKGIPSTIDETAVQQQSAKALSELNLLVTVTGKGAKKLTTGIIHGLNSLGLQAKTGESDSADIAVEAASEQEMMDDRAQDGWHWARSTVTVNMKDVKSGKIFLSFDVSDRQASASAKEAMRRGLVKISDQVAKKIEEGITDYFANQ